MNKQPSSLDILEIVAVLGSIGGAAVAIALDKLVWAAVPMSASLGLNFLNRKRAINDAIIRIERQVSAKVEMLQGQVKALPAQSDMRSVQSSLENLSASLAGLQSRVPKVQPPNPTVELNTLRQDIAGLRSQYSNMHDFLAGLRDRLETLPAPDRLEQMEIALNTLEEKMAQMPAKLQKLSASGSGQDLTSIVSQISQLQDRLNALPEAEIAEIKSQLEEIKITSDRLTGEIQNLADREELSSLVSAFEQLQQKQIDLEEAGVISSSSNMASQLEEARSLASRLEELSASSETADLSSVESSLHKIALSVQEFKEELENRVLLLEETFQAKYENVDSMQQNLSELQGSAEKLSDDMAAIQGERNNLAEMQAEIAGLRSGVESAAGLRLAIDALSSEVSKSRESGLLETLSESHSQLQQRLDELAAQLQSGNISLAKDVETAREEMQAIREATNKLEEDMRSAVRQSELANAKQTLLETIQQIQAGVEDSSKAPSNAEIESLIDSALDQSLGQFKQMVAGSSAARAKIVFDRPGIKAWLEEALLETEERLVIVCPWLSRQVVEELLDKFEAFLERDGTLEIGWGHLQDIEVGNFPLRANHQWETGNRGDRSNLYDALNLLEQLKEKYPDRVKVKILGTHENYLVSDTSWAWIASDNFLSADPQFPEREVALRVTDPQIIESLINRFYDPELNPATAKAYYNRGFERLDMGDFEGALEDYDRSIQLNPQQATAYNNRAMAKYNLANPEGAIEDYTKALRLNSTEWVTYFNRGVARYHLEDYQGAIADYNDAIRLAPEETTIYFQRAEAYRQMGAYEEAIASYSDLIERSADAVAYNNRGLARYNLEDYQGSIDDYTQALRLKPSDAVSYSNRGVARLKAGDARGAVRDFDKAIELNPEYASAYNNRGLACSSLDDRPAAIEDLRKAAELFEAAGDIYGSNQVKDALQKMDAELSTPSGQLGAEELSAEDLSVEELSVEDLSSEDLSAVSPEQESDSP
ncbi:MAG: tetratricopeptide repeat protein [Oscillatoria sp. SIO1A7]|nr:tetratricopeptide repeat protein [Oscillatoria sp. SIO1A7]